MVDRVQAVLACVGEKGTMLPHAFMPRCSTWASKALAGGELARRSLAEAQCRSYGSFLGFAPLHLLVVPHPQGLHYLYARILRGRKGDALAAVAGRGGECSGYGSGMNAMKKTKKMHLGMRGPS